jgi:hypothetical protein
MATLNPLFVAIWLTLATLAVAGAEPAERWTCAKWLDGREQRQSTTMETWLQGYMTSSNEWALALGWTVTPLQGPQVLPLLDQSCKSTPNARLADVVFDMIRSTFWPKNRRGSFRFTEFVDCEDYVAGCRIGHFLIPRCEATRCGFNVRIQDPGD